MSEKFFSCLWIERTEQPQYAATACKMAIRGKARRRAFLCNRKDSFI